MDKRWNTILKTYYDKYNSSIVFQRLGLHTDTKEFKVGEFFAEVINIYILTNTDVVPKEYKQLKGLKKESLRDNMTNVELALNILAEASTTELSKQKNPKGFKQNMAIAQKGGSVAKAARVQLESQLGRSVISKSKASDFLPPLTEDK